MRRVAPFLLRRETILVAFVLSAVASSLVDGFQAKTSEVWLTSVAAIAVFPALAWFTHKRQLLATWATILVLIAIGSGYLYDSVLGLTGRGDVGLAAMALKGTAGIYLTWGALIIHRERHLKE